MKIAYLASKFPPIVGGGETQVFLLAKNMSKLGHSVTVITDSRVREMTDPCCCCDFSIEYVNNFEDFCTTGYGFKESCEKIFQILLGGKYDIVHVHNLLPMLLVSIIRENIGSKVIFTFHNTPDPPNRVLGYFSDFELDKSIAENIIGQSKYDLLVAGSKFYYDWALKLGSDPVKTRHVYMGIDCEFFNPKLINNKIRYRRQYGFKEKDTIVTFPSRIIKRKGIFELIEALSKLKNGPIKNIKLFLPSMYTPFNDEVAKEVISMSKKLGVSEQLVIPSWHIDYQLMPVVYALSDLVVVPSYYEGLGLAVLESMSVGVPVVATNVVGINEIIENGVNGLLVEKQNSLQLSKAIGKILKDRSLYNRVSKLGIKTVVERFNIDTQISHLSDIYTCLLKKDEL